MARKADRKDLKRLDKFQVKMLTLLGEMQRHTRVLAGVGLVVTILVIAGFSLYYVNQSKQVALQDALADIEVSAQQIKSQFGKSISKEYQKLMDLRKKSQEEKDVAAKAKIEADMKALESGLEKRKPDLSKPRDQYLAFFQKHSDQLLGWRAAIAGTQILIEEEDYAASEKILAEVVNLSRANHFYQTQVRRLYAQVLEQSGKLDLAVEQYNLLEKYTSEDHLAEVQLLKAKSLIAAKKFSEARNVLVKMTNADTAGPESAEPKGKENEKALALLSILEAEG